MIKEKKTGKQKNNISNNNNKKTYFLVLVVSFQNKDPETKRDTQTLTEFMWELYVN